MKKKLLSVQRETLRHLAPAQLAGIAGGTKLDHSVFCTIVKIPPTERCNTTPTTTVFEV